MSGLRVEGCCPMGCGETLFLGAGGFVTCSVDVCPNPEATSLILQDPETEHVAKMTGDSWSVQHPLRERLDGDLFACDVHEALTELNGCPVTPGMYRVRLPFDSERLVWEWLAEVPE